MSAFCDLSVVINNNNYQVDMDLEGTLDWYWCGDVTASSLGYVRDTQAHFLHRKKNVEPQLFLGFSWRINGSVSVLAQTIGRTMFAEPSKNNCGLSISSASKTGFFQLSGTAMYSVGYRMLLRAPSDRKYRLKCYSTDWRCNLQGIATVYDGETSEATETVNQTGINGNNIHEWQVDFQGGTDRSMLLFTMDVTGAFTGVDQNIGIQGFTLGYAP